MKRALLNILVVLGLLTGSFTTVFAAPGSQVIGINVVLNTDPTDKVLADLGKYGKVRDVLTAIDAVTMQAPAANLPTIQALPYVVAANPDAERNGAPVTAVAAEDFSDGRNTWDLDAVNVTNFGSSTRTVPYDGSGVYVAVLDTGLLSTWNQYFPAERIAVQYARAFGGGGGEMGTVSEQPNKWQQDTDSHGTHVASTILGYSLRGTPVNGVAPKATVIPVKVLNQNGSGWSSVIARGIVYVAELKAGPLKNNPVVINMSLGGPVLDAVEKAAIDYAISQGVIIVASAGNNDVHGMGYPGAYAPVISVASVGWTGQWNPPGNRAWWNNLDVADPTSAADFYVSDFSSRQLPGQDLDVAAPGSWVVGPYQTNNSGFTSYYFLSGTSMASPHVAGIVALLAQKQPALTAANAEAVLEGSAIPLSPGCRSVREPDATYSYYQWCWGADATGAGLATADAALNALSTGKPRK